MTNTAIQRTRQEIQALICEWESDPCWDIEETEGFEAHHDELKAYRLKCEAEWKARTQRRLEEKAEELGVSGNTKLAAYVDRLEWKISDLVRQIERLEDKMIYDR